jgi:hypothetical protein
MNPITFIVGMLTIVSKVRDGVETHSTAQFAITRKPPFVLIVLASRILITSHIRPQTSRQLNIVHEQHPDQLFVLLC